MRQSSGVRLFYLGVGVGEPGLHCATGIPPQPDVLGGPSPSHLPAGDRSRESSEVSRKEPSMKFSDFVSSGAIRAELTSVDKESVIGELVDSLQAAGEISAADRDDIVKAILKREELGSTGIGRGIAVPHTKHPSVNKLVGTVGVSSDGVEFDSLDGEKVQLFFLLVSPPDRPGDHLRALENISRQLRDETFCRFLKQSKTTADIMQLLEEADNNQFG